MQTSCKIGKSNMPAAWLLKAQRCENQEKHFLEMVRMYVSRS